jgi:hypothetical protein
MDKGTILILFADGGAIVWDRETKQTIETFDWEKDKQHRECADIFLAIPEGQVYNGFLREAGDFKSAN